MAALRLDSFVAAEFRAFKRLEVPKVNQVNLIVGKNGAGKSCLLEALNVYARGGSWSVVTEVLSARNEMQFAQSIAVGTELASALDGLSHLFFGRRSLDRDSQAIHLGPNNADSLQVSLSIRWLPRRDGASITLRNGITQNIGDKEPYYLSSISANGKGEETLMPIGNPSLWLSRELWASGDRLMGGDCIFVSANSLTAVQAETYWDAISLTDFEHEAIESLNIVSPGVMGLSLVASSAGRIPIVRIEGARRPVPLKSQGDGMTRMLGLSLSAVNARGGLLLIDEIENGLHYSVQPDMWRMLFHLAQSLDVQIFATSHSWDCIQAFQQVASERKDVEGELIRLDRKGEQIVPTIFDEEELAIATREQIEVR